MDFLDHVKDDFVAKYDGGEAPTATPNNFNKDFGYFAFVSTFFFPLGSAKDSSG